MTDALSASDLELLAQQGDVDLLEWMTDRQTPVVNMPRPLPPGVIDLSTWRAGQGGRA
jgi:hypothetical protein